MAREVLQLWFATIDELYKGPLAFKAKETARKMATGQYLSIWQNRIIEDNPKKSG